MSSAPEVDPPLPGTNFPVIRNKRVLAAVEEYLTVTAQLKALELRKVQLRTQVIDGMDGAPVAFAGVRTLNVATIDPTPATPDRVVTKAMIGHVLRGTPARAGSKQLRIA